MSVNCQSANDWELIIASIFDQTEPVDPFLHYFLCIGKNKMGIQSFVQLLGPSL